MTEKQLGQALTSQDAHLTLNQSKAVRFWVTLRAPNFTFLTSSAHHQPGHLSLAMPIGAFIYMPDSWIKSILIAVIQFSDDYFFFFFFAMTSRSFFTSDWSCTSGNIAVSVPSTGEDRIMVATGRSRPPRSPPSSLLITMAMRMSRARWFFFLRRVFHYQNGSRSDLGSNPLNTISWMVLEYIALVVQIIITTYTLAVSRSERLVWPMRMWAFGYDLGCVLNLLMLYWRYWVVHRAQPDEDSGTPPLMNRCRTGLDLFFAIWFVMGNVWVFDSRFGSFRQAPKLHVLCISLLAWNAVAYSFPFLLFVLLCCCVPVVSIVAGYNINVGGSDRGASEDQISGLPSWRYKDSDDSLELGKSVKNNENPECCICLCKFKEKEEIRQLPCCHIFHLKCVDQWLRIISSCPLCKQEINR
ncbi:E3 ubiquitin-protein ligase At4g11680-like [Diospyros lotus]|uniref:E3 ubiquitin-protein ligase At4g11680-like n=1 Tax=Diospyros lotus TaxID=55363 RepID=UPI002259E2DF|nr:E3 ubiquitin-protein ligase At4g11680-like [Diospyros lotus]